MAHSLLNSLQTFTISGNRTGRFYSLPELERQGVGPISRLPVSIRIVLESVLRNFDGKRVTEDNVRRLANWRPKELRTEEIPFTVARILLQDFTGVPLLVDLASMRSAAARMNKSPQIVEPLVPVDLVVDHSVQDVRDHAEREVRARLGPERWGAAYAAGRLISIDSLMKNIDRVLRGGESTDS